MKKNQKLFLLSSLSLLLAFATCFLGKTLLPFPLLWDCHGTSLDAVLLWKIRLPRVCLGFLCGAALSLGGLVFQALFRNPLTTPFTLGVASGASLGATLCLHFGWVFSIGILSSLSFFSIAGALFSIGLIHMLSNIKGDHHTGTVLLAGVAIQFFFSSVILFFQYITDFVGSVRILRWLMGGIETVGFESVLMALPFVIFGFAGVWFFSEELNLLSTGDDLALTRGVEVSRVRRLLFFITSLLVGGVVSVCGPIGFVGLMVPHVFRLLLGPDHRVLIPAVFFGGGAFLTVCDLLARTWIAPAEMPVGIITALLGGPFFLWLLVKKSSSFR